MEREAGLAEIVKSGGVAETTRTVRWSRWWMVPSVAFTVRMYNPNGVEDVEDAVIVASADFELGIVTEDEAGETVTWLGTVEFEATSPAVIATEPVYEWKLVRFRWKPTDCPGMMVVEDAGTASKLKFGVEDGDHAFVLVATASNEKVTDELGPFGMCPDSENSSRKPVAASL
jgi:hypothetical protein